MLLFENLDLTPIHPILWTGLHRQGPGRPVEYQPEWDLKALMLRQLHQIPYMKDRVKRLKRNPILRHACGYREKAPTEAHFSQMKKWIGAEGFRVIEAWLRREALNPQGESATIRHGPRPGRLHRRHRPQSLKQQKPRRQQEGKG